MPAARNVCFYDFEVAECGHGPEGTEPAVGGGEAVVFCSVELKGHEILPVFSKDGAHVVEVYIPVGFRSIAVALAAGVAEDDVQRVQIPEARKDVAEGEGVDEAVSQIEDLQGVALVEGPLCGLQAEGEPVEAEEVEALEARVEEDGLDV